MKRFVVLGLTAILASCGGGGGSGPSPVPVQTSPCPAGYTGTPPNCVAPAGNVVANPASVALMDLSAVQQVTLQDTNQLATTYTIDGSTCSGVATVKQTSTNTFQFTAVALGTCAVTASDNLGHSTAVQVSVQTTSVGIQ